MRFGRTAAVAAAAALLAGCAGAAGSDGGGRVVVSAAGSLSDAFAGVEAAFESVHPGIDVVLNPAASSALREQILDGAPADVFASADTKNMDLVVAAGEAAGAPVVFARNSLQIAVPAGNPAAVTGLDDFARPDLLLGLCAAGVPCGDFAREALERAGVVPILDTEEPNVRALLTKVAAGELDAGITYVTDVAASDGAVDGIGIPAGVNVNAEYPIVVLAGSANPEAASAFVDFVGSAAGQAILARYGFEAP